ncbi:MAG: glycosyltransferase family 2 protein [Bacteroidales bacterium]|nr:glycosyltransferase family 2 protein [Bacteroidales bacterium]
MTYCAVIPTYNNASTVADIVRRTLAVCPDVIVVNDGSTDNTLDELSGIECKIVSYSHNRGKGYALRRGLEAAREAGYDYAVTIDSDGQHCPEEIPQLIAAIGYKPTLVVGSRNLQADGMPAGNSFANRFSNFWFTLQTGLRLPDTQTGFRAYPLHHLPCLSLLTRRYESELLLLVLSAWRGVRIVPVPVSVSYPTNRVSHFRPFRDFMRISVLNALLCLLAIVYGYPRMLISKLTCKQ